MPQNLNNKGLYRVLGLMSGTSLDGLDLCLVDFPIGHPAEFQMVATQTIPYTSFWQEQLRFRALKAEELLNLDQQYSLELARMVNDFILNHSVDSSKIDLLASHGHTWFHQPKKGYTLQIGNRASLAVETGLPVVCDFRVQDIALGGEGAPLVPIGDRDLFGQYPACLNLGGFANISLQEKEQRIAFDIGPCNLPMNHYCQQLGLNYDDHGHIAASFAHHEKLFHDLNALPHYQLPAPKSLGREWMEEELLPRIDSYSLSPEVKIATLNRHAAFQISASLKRHQIKKVLVSGGGALNETLIDSLGIWGVIDIEIAEAKILHFKEALLFAYLGYLFEKGAPNVLASVTGASKDHRSGRRFEP